MAQGPLFMENGLVLDAFAGALTLLQGGPIQSALAPFIQRSNER